MGHRRSATVLKMRPLIAGALLALAGISETGAQAGSCPEEAARAEAVKHRIIAEWPLRPTDYVVDYVRSLGRSLARRAGIARDAHWRFLVVRDRSANGFSIGDGVIFITEGAILAAKDEADLAGLIAHEMGHEVAGHFCPGASGQGDRSSHGGPSFGIGSLRQGMDPAKEQEADHLAARILAEAGLGPQQGEVGQHHWSGRAVVSVPRPGTRRITPASEPGLDYAKRLLMQDL